MAEAHVSGELPLSQDDAWKLLSDLPRFDEWMTIHDSWKSEIPELTVGGKLTEQLTVMGMTNVIEWTIDEYAPPPLASLKISGAGLAGAQIAFTLSVRATEAHSTVSIDAEFTGQMMVGAIGDAVQKNATVELEKSLAKLQEIAS